MVDVKDSDGNAVITCYTEEDPAIGTLVFSDRTLKKFSSLSISGHKAVPVVTGNQSNLTKDHRFFGVTLGDSDHGFVAVAVSGPVTALCSHQDLVDSFPTDLIECDCGQQRQLFSNKGTSATVALHSVPSDQKPNPLRTIGILLAHGRNPANMARFLLLPGIGDLPSAPGTPHANDNHPDCEEADDTSLVDSGMAVQPEDDNDFVESLSLAKLKIVNLGDQEFNTSVSQFIGYVESVYRENKEPFFNAVSQ